LLRADSSEWLFSLLYAFIIDVSTCPMCREGLREGKKVTLMIRRILYFTLYFVRKLGLATQERFTLFEDVFSTTNGHVVWPGYLVSS
jgi:hypothetical protein